MKIPWLSKFFVGLVGALVIALGLSMTTSSASINFYYTVRDLGTLGGSRLSAATGINDKGQVVGFASISSGDNHAFVWQDGTMKDLGTLSGSFSYASGINNKEQIIGWAVTSSGLVHACLWEHNTIKDLGTFGGSFSYAIDINNRGQVVGRAETSTTTHAYLWENGKMRDLGTLGGFISSAYSINDKEQVVGSAVTSSGATHAFIWEKGTMRDLGTLSSDYSEAYSINNRGQVVGYSYLNSSTATNQQWNGNELEVRQQKAKEHEDVKIWRIPQGIQASALLTDIKSRLDSPPSRPLSVPPPHPIPIHPFLWEKGIIRDLGTLGYYWSYAERINNRGQVVGRATNINKLNHAFLWHSGRVRDLNSLIPANSGWELFDAVDINNKGQIVGSGRFNGQDRAFLLTPTWVTN